MPLGQAKSRKIQTDQLPGPIATCYRRIFTRHEQDVERLMFVLDTAEITARFLSAVVLCSLRELVQHSNLEPPLVDLGDSSTRLKRPSFGLWMEILRRGAQRLYGHDDWFSDESARTLAMDVCGYVLNEHHKTKGRPYAYLDAILVIRNKVHHPTEDLHISDLCEQAEQLIHQALEQLAFFEKYTLYVVKQINVRRRRLSALEYQHQCFLLQGEIDFPIAESDDRTWHTDTGDVLVYRGETSYLNLDPLFVYVNADEIDKDKIGSNKHSEALYPGMYCFAGYASKSSRIVVDYLPCASSSRSFRTSNEAFRDTEMTDCLDQGVEELLQLLANKPKPETAKV